MSKANISQKLERKGDEDVSPTSNTCCETDHNSPSFVKSDDNSSKNTKLESVPNKDNMAKRNVSVALKPASKQETKEVLADDNLDQTDGNMVAYMRWDWPDDELKSHKVKLFSCSQQPGEGEGFLKMVVDSEVETGLNVTTNGMQNDPHALWTTHYTLDNDRRQVLIFENEKCSDQTNTKCVLWTQKVGDTLDYRLTGKKIQAIPKRLMDIDPSSGFFKRPKSVGSELLYLKSMYSSKEKPLLVGFDGAGQPLPLNKVKKYSPDFQAFFRIIPG